MSVLKSIMLIVGPCLRGATRGMVPCGVLSRDSCGFGPRACSPDLGREAPEEPRAAHYLG